MTRRANWQQLGLPTKHSMAKKTPCTCGINHDSRREAQRCVELRMLERGGAIAGLKQQPRYDFIANGQPVMMENGQRAHVTLDFSYVDLRAGGILVAEDVKGRSRMADSRDWPLRKALFRHLFPAIELREVRG